MIGEGFTAEPGAHLDLGDVTLLEGGRIKLSPQPSWPADVLALVYKDRHWVATLWEKTDFRSPLLAPGDYDVLVRGVGVAAMALEATVQPGGESTPRVTPILGYEQRFELPSASDSLSEALTVQLTPLGERPITMVLTPEIGKPVSFTEFLRLGPHTIRVQAGEVVREATFTVTLGSRDVVRLALP